MVSLPGLEQRVARIVVDECLRHARQPPQKRASALTERGTDTAACRHQCSGRLREKPTIPKTYGKKKKRREDRRKRSDSPKPPQLFPGIGRRRYRRQTPTGWIPHARHGQRQRNKTQNQAAR